MMLCVSADAMQMNVNAHVNVVRAAAVCSEIEFVLSVCVYWRMTRETAFESYSIRMTTIQRVDALFKLDSG